MIPDEAPKHWLGCETDDDLVCHHCKAPLTVVDERGANGYWDAWCSECGADYETETEER